MTDNSRDQGRFSERVRISQGIVFSFGDQMLQFALTFTASVLTARIYGASVLGDLAIIMILLSSFRTLSGFLGSSGLIRQMNAYSKDSVQASRLFWSVLLTSLAVSLLSLCLFVPAGNLILKQIYHRSDLRTHYVTLLVATSMVVVPMQRMTNAFVAYQEARYLALAHLMMKLANIALAAVIPSISEANLEALIWVLVGTDVSQLVVLAVMLHRVVGPYPGFRLLLRAGADVRAVIRYDLRASPVGLSELALENAGRAVLGYQLPPAILGAYDRAHTLYKQLYVIPLLVGRMVYPSLCRLAHRGETDEMTQIVSRILQHLLLIMTPAAFWLAAASPAVLRIFGQDFVIAAPALSILAFGIVFDTVGRMNGAVIGSMNRPELLSAITVTGAVLNTVLNLILAPRWGLIGSAVAYLIAYATMSVASIAIVTHALRLVLRQVLEPAFLAKLMTCSSLMGMIVWLGAQQSTSEWAILVLAPSGFVIYLLPALALGLVKTKTLTSIKFALTSVRWITRNGQ